MSSPAIADSITWTSRIINALGSRASADAVIRVVTTTSKTSQIRALTRVFEPDRVLAEYEQHYNTHRAHQSRDQRPPLHDPDQPIDLTAVIKHRTTVTGLIHEYRRAA